MRGLKERDPLLSLLCIGILFEEVEDETGFGEDVEVERQSWPKHLISREVVDLHEFVGLNLFDDYTDLLPLFRLVDF